MSLATGIGAFAGCANNSGGGGTTTIDPGYNPTAEGDGGTAADTPEEGEVGEPVEPTFDLLMRNSPESANAHASVGGAYVDPITWSSARRGILNPSGRFIGLLFEEQGIVGENNDIYEVKLNEDHTWHNGEKCTVDDMYWRDKLNYEYNKLTSEPGAKFSEWSEIERVDDYTIRYHLHGPVNEAVFISEREMEPNFPRWDYKRWAETMEEATTAQAAEQVYGQFNKQQKPLSEYVGNGAFQISEVNDTTVLLEKYEDYPFAHRNNIQQVKFHFVGGDAAARLKWKNGVVDYGELPPGNVQLPDRYREVHYVENEGLGTQFNLNNKHFAKRKVRQAINFLFDRRAANRNSGRAFAPEIQTGMPTVTARNWLSDYESFKENCIRYGPKAKPEQAKKLLRQAGYSKSGGNWVDPDGEVVKFTIRTPSLYNKYWDDITQTYNAQLQQFGFKTEFELINISAWFGTWDPEKLNSDVCWVPHGPDELVHPSPAFANQTQWWGHPLTGAAGGGSPDEHFAGQPWEIDVPKEVGVLDPSPSQTETVNLLDLQAELADPNLTEERAVELTDTWARIVNYNVAQPFDSENDVSYAYDAENFVYENFRENAKYPPDKDYFAVPAGFLRSKNK